jgi:hypothetical protein
MSKKLIITIIVIALVIIGIVIGVCILLGTIDWAQIIGDFLGKIWGNEH